MFISKYFGCSIGSWRDSTRPTSGRSSASNISLRRLGAARAVGRVNQIIVICDIPQPVVARCRSDIFAKKGVGDLFDVPKLERSSTSMGSSRIGVGEQSPYATSTVVAFQVSSTTLRYYQDIRATLLIASHLGCKRSPGRQSCGTAPGWICLVLLRKNQSSLQGHLATFPIPLELPCIEDNPIHATAT